MDNGSSRRVVRVFAAWAVASFLVSEASAPAQERSSDSKLETSQELHEIRKARERLHHAWRERGARFERGELRADPWQGRLQAKILAEEELEALFGAERPEFPEPEVIRSRDGVLEATLRVARARNFIGSDPVELRCYNGKLVGPTLRCKPGDVLKIEVVNDLAPSAYLPGAMDTLHNFDSTNLHTHGLHVSPSGNSDNVLLSIEPQSSQRYEIAIPADHPCGSFWYHAHMHGSTAANVGSGMSGALIIEGGIDELPAIAAARERIFVLQQIPYVNNASKSVCDSIPKDADLAVGVIEAKYADCSFGPGTWDVLGRHTSINGVLLPVIRIRPGAVERWRFIDSAVREVIQPELVRVDAGGNDCAERLEFHEIAVDGLPLGRLATRTQLELWPGYRSDVLVRAPFRAGAQYILRDARVPAPDAKFSEERRYLALVVVEGEELRMELPSDAALAPFRVPSIRPEEVTGREVAAYGILPTPSGVSFTIDRTAFGHDEARVLTLGEVLEWSLTSRNHVGPVSHPFHIHINPFEIFSILDSEGREQLDRDPKTGAVLPVWRDTIILHEAWEVRFRTRITDFDGVYVQHCHILDHEDQGMMELVQIQRPPSTDSQQSARHAYAASEAKPLRPYLAADWSLEDSGGKTWRYSELPATPTLLVFYEGLGCVRCNEQLQELQRQLSRFHALGVRVLAIGIDTVEELRASEVKKSYSFPLLADPEKESFRSYGCYAGGPLHGVFLASRERQILWQTVSREPFTDFDFLIQECRSQFSTPRVAGSSPAARRTQQRRENRGGSR